MKQLFLLFTISVFMLSQASFVFASSDQAYQGYQYQFGQYRQALSDFQSSYTQYKQFNSLVSQQDAVTKGQLLLIQRNQTAKAYFLFLNEKLNENPGMGNAEAQPYRTSITNQISLLDANTTTAASVGTLSDITTVSSQFVKNYFAMQMTYRQTIVALELGYLQYFLTQFDTQASQAQLLIAESGGSATPEKIAVLNRWLVNLSNEHSILTQDLTTIRSATPKITGDILEQDRQLSSIQKMFSVAKQHLTEAVSYLAEVQTALQYE